MQPPAQTAIYTDSWMTSNLLAPSTGILFALAYLINNRMTRGITATAAGYSGFSSIPRTWKEFLIGFKYDDFLRKRLAHVAQCTKIIQELHTMVPQEMRQQLTFFKHIERVFDELPKVDAELADVIKNLNSATFDIDPQSSDSTSIFFRRGKMLRVYRLLDRIKTVLEPAIAAVGEIDAFLTVAKLIRESQGGRAPYCFAKYVSNALMPSIELKDFWNPFLDQQTVVTNSIGMGVDYKVPHMVVTGPNSGGKSTILKGIALSVILAQSLGIAPAHTMTLTPFGHLAVYMNIADSIVNKESRFQREGQQAFAHGDHIKALSEHGSFSLAIFDEIFSGTSPEEGAEWGYATAAGFARYSNCICVVATHFPKLTDLEKDTQGHFVNYKVSIEEDANGNFKVDAQGKLKRKYTLERGISLQHIAHAVLQEQGINSPFFNQNFAL